MEASPTCGAVIEPRTAVFTYRRLREPAAQRTPCPNGTPFAFAALPWSTRLGADGPSLSVVNTTVSFASDGIPAALSAAPPVEDELSQPRCAPDGGFPQGQEATPAKPGSQKLVRSRGPSTSASVW